jgi:hypothetical protein
MASVSRTSVSISAAGEEKAGVIAGESASCDAGVSGSSGITDLL